MKTTKLYVVRHGESVANREEICGGDWPLTEKGEQQAAETRQLLAGVRFDAVYSSDLVRAVKTAEIISGQTVPSEHQLRELRERDFGKLEGGPNAAWYELMHAHEEQYRNLPFEQRMEHEYADFVEGDKALCDRFLAALRTIAAGHPGQTVLVASHAGPIRVTLMKLGFTDFLTAGSFKNAGYVEIDYDGESLQIGEVVGIQDPTSTNA